MTHPLLRPPQTDWPLMWFAVGLALLAAPAVAALSFIIYPGF